MERWRPETNTFHMYHGEVSLTLYDVAHLTGLLVTGDALYVEYEKETNWAAIVEEVLGKSPGGHLKDGGRVQMRWLHDNFYSCADLDSAVRMRVHVVNHRSILTGGPIQCIRALSVSSGVLGVTTICLGRSSFILDVPRAWQGHF
ncbi:Protein MAIN-LIKE 2 [Linum grandiflorum]